MKDTGNEWRHIEALGLEDSHDKLKNETTEMLTMQAGDVISHSIKLDVSVGVSSPPPNPGLFQVQSMSEPSGQVLFSAPTVFLF